MNPFMTMVIGAGLGLRGLATRMTSISPLAEQCRS